MTIKVTVPNTSSDSLTFGSANTPTAAQVVGIDSGSSNGQLAFNTTASGTSTERMRIDASGNVGIGTSSPISTAKQTIKQSSGGGTGSTQLHLEQNNTTDGYDLKCDAADGDLAFLRYASGSATERMRITGSGNLLVGTTTLGGKVTTLVGTSQVGFYQNKPSTGNADHQQFYTDGTLFAKMNNRGSWYNFDNVYGSLSDRYLKDEIVDATLKLNDLNQVQIRNFVFKADETKSKQIGVIAQELESVFPSMVDTDGDGIKSVKYSVFVPILIKSIQELKAIVDTQAEALASLTTRLAALEAK